jgi:hypothetical protein
MFKDVRTGRTHTSMADLLGGRTSTSMAGLLGARISQNYRVGDSSDDDSGGDCYGGNSSDAYY